MGGEGVGLGGWGLGVLGVAWRHAVAQAVHGVAWHVGWGSGVVGVVRAGGWYMRGVVRAGGVSAWIGVCAQAALGAPLRSSFPPHPMEANLPRGQEGVAAAEQPGPPHCLPHCLPHGPVQIFKEEESLLWSENLQNRTLDQLGLASQDGGLACSTGTGTSHCRGRGATGAGAHVLPFLAG